MRCAWTASRSTTSWTRCARRSPRRSSRRAGSSRSARRCSPRPSARPSGSSRTPCASRRSWSPTRRSPGRPSGPPRRSSRTPAPVSARSAWAPRTTPTRSSTRSRSTSRSSSPPCNAAASACRARTSRPKSASALLELAGLTRRYGDRIALDGLSFDVAEGQLFGFVGPNGAGKTPAMRIVLGVLRADAGEVRWRGAPVDPAMRRRFGYMPEERGLYPKMRVREQLVYLARLHGLSADDAAGAAAHWIDRLGLTERADERVEKLSLGNQQRVQLAAALVHGPDVLVLDEPFSGLDPVGVDVMSGVLGEEAARGVPVLFSSHQLELVERLCEAVAIVKDGRLVASGRVEDLRARGAAERRRVRVELAEPPPPGWLAALEGAGRVEPLPRGALVELSDGARPDAVLDAARAAGSVTHFSLERPTLAQLFREAVAA